MHGRIVAGALTCPSLLDYGHYLQCRGSVGISSCCARGRRVIQSPEIHCLNLANGHIDGGAKSQVCGKLPLLRCLRSLSMGMVGILKFSILVHNLDAYDIHFIFKWIFSVGTTRRRHTDFCSQTGCGVDQGFDRDEHRPWKGDVGGAKLSLNSTSE